jgi:hypothetical protein
VSPDGRTATHLLRVTADDPGYLRPAAAEAAYWERVHPMGLEAGEELYLEGQVEQYVNERFTGDRSTDRVSTIPRWGAFTHGLLLGASSPRREWRVPETNPQVRMTLVDISPGAVQRRVGALAARFVDRIQLALLKRRRGILQQTFEIDPQYLAELRLIGDMLTDAGIPQPGVAFAVYRKRRA